MATALDRLGLPAREERVRVPGGGVDWVVTPESVESLAEVVRAAGEDRAGLLVLGGRSRLDLANPADPLELGVSLSGISGIDEFEPEEGVLHARAGTPIRAVREAVLVQGWELPLDSPGRDSTVGGTIASAVTGPRAHAFGPVKDAILGLEVVGGDGVATKCGGRVVKNVTGYDLAKLYCGSFGTLSIVTGAWLRLRPAPATRLVFEAEVSSQVAAFEAVRKLAARPGVRALVWRQAPAESVAVRSTSASASASTSPSPSPSTAPSTARVLIELGGSAEGVEHDRLAFAEALELEEAPADAIDREREARVDDGNEVCVRARVPGSATGEWVRAALAAGLAVSVDPGLGVAHATGAADFGPDVARAQGAASPLDVLETLRAHAIRLGGFATFERLPAAARGAVDVFGVPDETARITRLLAERFDPKGILNPGRFVPRPGGGRAA